MYDSDDLYIDEFGRPIPRYNPIDPDKRGRHRTSVSALDAALKDLLIERNDFFDSLADKWPTLFPGSAIRPGRYDGGIIFLYVRSASALFANRGKLPAIKRKLAELPGAPAKLDLKLEIRK